MSQYIHEYKLEQCTITFSVGHGHARCPLLPARLQKIQCPQCPMPDNYKTGNARFCPCPKMRKRACPRAKTGIKSSRNSDKFPSKLDKNHYNFKILFQFSALEPRNWRKSEFLESKPENRFLYYEALWGNLKELLCNARFDARCPMFNARAR